MCNAATHASNRPPQGVTSVHDVVLVARHLPSSFTSLGAQGWSRHCSAQVATQVCVVTGRGGRLFGILRVRRFAMVRSWCLSCSMLRPRSSFVGAFAFWPVCCSFRVAIARCQSEIFRARTWQRQHTFSLWPVVPSSAVQLVARRPRRCCVTAAVAVLEAAHGVCPRQCSQQLVALLKHLATRVHAARRRRSRASNAFFFHF